MKSNLDWIARRRYRCGTHAESFAHTTCPNRALLEFLVQENHKTKGLDNCPYHFENFTSVARRAPG